VHYAQLIIRGVGSAGFRVGTHDIIYEIQYRHHVQRGHCLLHEKESREEHLLSNSLYLPIHLVIASH